MSKERRMSLSHKNFSRIVCVGASAGGLQALITLFKALPRNIRMAFVLIQHLEPQHKSALTEIISRTTPLNIHEAKNNMRIEPSHVYVIPPNTRITVSHGKLKITRRIKRVDGRYLPIDFFMVSLANDQKRKAVGIVLSGTGSDGTLGVKAIKEKGGITFAQNELTAGYYGMPESAIASGSVDFVIDPAAMARKLIDIDAHGYKPQAKQAEAPLNAAQDLTKILVLLQDLTGVDFIHYKQGTITRRIARRMSFLHIKNYSDYYDYLKKNPSEADLLRKDILIPVTSFFRDPKVFTALRKSVFPAISLNHSLKKPIRIWVPACSTGEEVYSIALCLYEFLEEWKIKPALQIFGTDLSELVIEKARSGFYTKDMVAHVSAAQLRRFFIKTETGYKIGKPIRDLCIFAKHDITNDPPLSNMDMVSCRNLLIYLGAFLQNKALSMLHYALKPKGFLVLGTSESVTAVPNFFTTIDHKMKIYSKNIAPRTFRLNTSTPRLRQKKTTPKRRRIFKTIRTKLGTDPWALQAPSKEQRKKMPDILKAIPSEKMDRNAVKNVVKLKREFARTVQSLNALSEEKDTVNEELRAANEEIQSSNEELQSMNEELETSKEELQSTNEELLSLNDELQNKNEELTHLNNDLSNVFSNTNMPMIIVGNNLRIKRFTPTARKVMNLIATDIDRPIGDIKLNINIANLEEMILGVIEDMSPKESEVQDSSGRWYAVRIRPYRTLDNKIDGAVISMIDIDAMKRIRDRIQSALEFTQAIIETMREPLVVLDKEARVLSANKAFYQAFMLQASAIENKPIYEIGGHQWSDSNLRNALEEVLPKKNYFNDLEMSFDLPKAGQKTMLLNGRQIKMQDKNQKMTLLVLEDITKRKKADEVLKRDNETLEQMAKQRSRELVNLQMRLERTKFLSDVGTLAATIAHELRNTLAAINIATYNIKRKTHDAKIKINLTNIAKMVFEGEQIINNVLSYSKIKISHFEETELNSLLKNCMLAIKDRALAQGIDLHSKLELTKGLSIEADPTQLKETFSNILNNAVDAVKSDTGSITLETQIHKSAVSIWISDNGPGIPKEDLDKVLSPFFTTKAKGTGLGLAVCNQIVMLHDGAIVIESPKGKGTRVKVTLPLSRS